MLVIALRHVGRQQRFVRGARQLERIGGRPAAPDHEDEATHSGLEVAQHTLGARAVADTSSAPASSTITSAPGSSARSESTATAEGTAARAARAAIARIRERQPSWAGAWGCAWATRTDAPGSRVGAGRPRGPPPATPRVH